MEDELEAMCPNTVRVVAHPQKDWLPRLPRMRDIKVPPGGRMLVAVGPEAGWQDPYELDLLSEHGFQVCFKQTKTYYIAVSNKPYGFQVCFKQTRCQKL